MFYITTVKLILLALLIAVAISAVAISIDDSAVAISIEDSLMKMMNFMAFNKVVLLTLFCCFLPVVLLVTGNTCFCDQF